MPEEGCDLARALDEASGILGRMEARILLSHATGMSASAIATHPEKRLQASEENFFRALVARRTAGEPIAYIVGTREFYGRDFSVTADVLIPRPETELLVELGLARLIDVVTPRILDLGCGSACISISLALERPEASVTAVDCSAAALAVARSNAAVLRAKLRCIESDWCAALGNERFHLIVSNPPYIPAADPHLFQGDLRFEPRSALASGASGLDAIHSIIAQASKHLLPGGLLMIEHGYDQAEALRALLQGAGYADIEQHLDLAGIIRVSIGRLCSTNNPETD